MSIHQLSNYPIVCEATWSGFGCGAELLIEQARSIPDAADRAATQDWAIFPPSPWDDSRTWSARCPACNAAWQQRIAAIDRGKGVATP